jgi:hypothetical protein
MPHLTCWPSLRLVHQTACWSQVHWLFLPLLTCCKKIERAALPRYFSLWKKATIVAERPNTRRKQDEVGFFSCLPLTPEIGHFGRFLHIRRMSGLNGR